MPLSPPHDVEVLARLEDDLRPEDLAPAAELSRPPSSPLVPWLVATARSGERRPRTARGAHRAPRTAEQRKPGSTGDAAAPVAAESRFPFGIAAVLAILALVPAAPPWQGAGLWCRCSCWPPCCSGSSRPGAPPTRTDNLSAVGSSAERHLCRKGVMPHMDRTGWTRDPVVAVAGGSLVLECIGWVVWVVHGMATGTATFPAWDFRILAIFVGTAALLVRCAVEVLRGRRVFAVGAACVILLFTGFSGPWVALVNITVIGLLTWANARLRGPAGEAGRAARRDPVVLLAAGGCAAAAGVIVVRVVNRVVEDGARYPWPVWPDPGILLQVAPALVLAGATAGILRGSPRWAAVALAAIVVGGAAAVTRAEGVVTVTALVAVSLALLVAVGSAGERLLRPDHGPDREPDEPQRSDRTP